MAVQKRSNVWTKEQLQAYGKASAAGYLPGVMDSEAPTDDVWTTERHLRMAQLRTQVFIPGF